MMAGMFAKLFGRRETRDFFGAGIGLPMVSGGRLITPQAAENLAVILAAIQAISGSVATLPGLVYQHTATGRIEAPGHPVAALIRRPNARQTWPDFVEWWLAQTLLYGNGLAEIVFNGGGRPVGLEPIPWPFVSVRLLPTGRLAFDVVAYQGQFGGTGLPRRLLQDEVLHLKDRSDDGWLGRSRLARAPETVENALGLQSYTNELWREGVMPSGVLKHPKALSDQARKRLKTDAEEYRGVQRSRRMLMLEEGLDFQTISFDPETAEVLNSRRFSVEEVARLYGVPPPILQDYTRNTFSNAATAGAWFGQFSILPWANKVAAEVGRVLLTDQFHLELDMSGLLRGDYAQRWQANVAAVGAGILTPNEIRSSEGWNAHADGDLLRIMPGAMVPASPAEPVP